MRFSETALERQMRVKNDWEQLWKGNKTGPQFEASFEEALTELEIAGIGKSQLELKLDYLHKVGPQLAAEILNDSRAWTNADGFIVIRKVETWEECHKVLLEVESIRAGGRALQGSYAAQSDLVGYPKGGRGRKKQIAVLLIT